MKCIQCKSNLTYEWDSAIGKWDIVCLNAHRWHAVYTISEDEGTKLLHEDYRGGSTHRGADPKLPPRI